MKFCARDLAPAWLSVSLASSSDKLRPALFRTVLVEQFSAGVRLVATDSYSLLASWVPCADDPDAPEPDLAEAPMVVAVPIDEHGRARSLMGHALALADKLDDDGPDVEVSLRLGIIDLLDAEDRPTLDGLEPEIATIEVPDRERLRLRVYDGEFPTWRNLVRPWQRVETDALAIAGERTALLAKLAKYCGSLGLTFGGPDRPVRVESLRRWPAVAGLVMPCRWDIESNRPADEAEADDAETEDDPEGEGE